MQHLTFHGRVQGVGFRDFVRRTALESGVAGWTSNRSDGAVEVVLQGPAAAVAQVNAQLRAGPPLARIDAVEQRLPDPDEWYAGHSGFEVRSGLTAVAMPTSDTVDAYRATDYFALATSADPHREVFRIDDAAGLHAAWLTRQQARSATILTAWNPLGEDSAREANDAAQARLQATLEIAGLRFRPASGEDPRGLWAPEPGFCVFDVDAVQLDVWLRSFRQNAAVQLDAQRACRLVWHPQIRRRLPRPATN